MGNKTDLGEERQVSLEDARQVVRTLGVNFMETSIAQGTSVAAAYEVLVKAVMQRCPDKARVTTKKK